VLGRLLSALPGVNLLWGVACALLALAGAYTYLGKIEVEQDAQRLRASLAEERADRARERESLTAQALKESERARNIEAAWVNKHQEIARDAEELARRHAAAVAAGAVAGNGLRERAAALAATATRCAAPADPAPATVSPPAGNPAVVLADVLGRLEAAGRELAAVADARAAAGSACERAYEALRRP
jgi:hypothetical protein